MVWASRAICILAEAGGIGPLALYSCYFRTNTFDKMKALATSMRLLAGLGEAAMNVGVAAILAADRQMEPRVVENTCFYDQSNCVVKEDPSRRESVPLRGECSPA